MVAAPAVCDDLAYSPGPPAETFKLAIPHSCNSSSYLDVPRVWTGLWQLSSPAWGTAPAARIRREMKKHVDKGFVAFGEYPIRYSFALSLPSSLPGRTISRLHRLVGGPLFAVPCVLAMRNLCRW